MNYLLPNATQIYVNQSRVNGLFISIATRIRVARHLPHLSLPNRTPSPKEYPKRSFLFSFSLPNPKSPSLSSSGKPPWRRWREIQAWIPALGRLRRRRGSRGSSSRKWCCGTLNLTPASNGSVPSTRSFPFSSYLLIYEFLFLVCCNV